MFMVVIACVVMAMLMIMALLRPTAVRVTAVTIMIVTTRMPAGLFRPAVRRAVACRRHAVRAQRGLVVRMRAARAGMTGGRIVFVAGVLRLGHRNLLMA